MGYGSNYEESARCDSWGFRANKRIVVAKFLRHTDSDNVICTINNR